MPIVIIDVAPTRLLELQRLLESSPFRNDVIVPSNTVPEARTARTSAKIIDLREDIESMHEMLLKVATEVYIPRRKEKHRPWKPDHWRK